MSSMSDKLNGKFKQTAGKATNNKELEARGKAQETIGHAKEALKSTGERLSDKLQDVTKKLEK